MDVGCDVKTGMQIFSLSNWKDGIANAEMGDGAEKAGMVEAGLGSADESLVLDMSLMGHESHIMKL